MASDNSHETEIPTLDDLVVVEKASETEPTGKPSAFSPEASTKPLPRNNPFLPYEHLEQLARERAEFQKQFIQFSVSKPASAPPSKTQTAPSAHQGEPALLDQLADQIAEQLISDIRPLIEQRIREALEQHLTPPSAKRR